MKMEESNNLDKRPLVGVAIFIANCNGEIVMGKRKGSHGAGTWSIPGGHLEYGEDFLTCCAREVKEETNLIVSKIEEVTFKNVIHEGKHYITLYFKATVWGGELKTMEPEKCEGWEWVEAMDMPKPLFEPMDLIVRQHKWIIE